MSEPTQHVSAAARNARTEAGEVAGGEHTVSVLEPSPPSIVDGNWFADDPVAIGDESGKPWISPIPGAGTGASWDDWLIDHPEHRAWAARRWLGAFPRLSAPPETLVATRLALHRLALYAVSPARRRDNGKIAMRWTLDGFGTPFFGHDEQVRVEGTTLVRQVGSTANSQAITTLRQAAQFALDGPPDAEWVKELDLPELGDPDADLEVDPQSAGFLASWNGFATSVLEQIRSDAASIEASRVQLWPEHFDLAFECLPGEQRAGYGASPGDEAMPEPYLYVVPWHFAAQPASHLWNATNLEGAVLPLRRILSAPDQRVEAVGFFRRYRDVLAKR